MTQEVPTAVRRSGSGNGTELCKISHSDNAVRKVPGAETGDSQRFPDTERDARGARRGRCRRASSPAGLTRARQEALGEAGESEGPGGDVTSCPSGCRAPAVTGGAPTGSAPKFHFPVSTVAAHVLVWIGPCDKGRESAPERARPAAGGLQRGQRE